MEASGAGAFTVTVGERHFTCLGIFELCAPVTKLTPDAAFAVSYVTEAGRTVLVRHYCHEARPMLNNQGDRVKVVVDKDEQVVIDGVTFVHCYDSLSNLAFGF